jgi:hypothetical protein
MKNNTTTYQVQSVHDHVLSTRPLRTGKMVYFTGTQAEAKMWSRSLKHADQVRKAFEGTTYKSRSTIVREVSLENA